MALAGAKGASTAHFASLQTMPQIATSEIGYQSLKTTADEIFGAPLTLDGAYPFPQYFQNDKTHFTHSVPQLYLGENRTTLPTQIVFQQILAGNFYVQRIAPIVPITWANNYTVQWDSLTFKPNLPQVLPEEGRTRIGGWNYDVQQATVQRYGLGARFSHDFLLTPKGMVLARGVMDQINISIEEHLKIGVIHAIQRCRDAALARLAESNNAPTSNQQAHNLERNKFFFGLLQFHDNGVTLLINFVRDTMNKYGGVFDVILMHWLVAMYTTNLIEKTTTYNLIGDSAKANFEAIISSPHRFGGIEAFLVQEFAQGRGQPPLELLRRRIVVGEYLVMFDHLRYYAGNNYSNYRTEHRSIEVLAGDNNNDKREVITLEQALYNTRIWDENTGELIGPDHPSLKEFGVDKNWPDKRCSFWYRGTDGVDRSIKYFGHQALAWFGTGSLENLAQTVLNGVPLSTREQIVTALYTLVTHLEQMSRAEYSVANVQYMYAVQAALVNNNGTLPTNTTGSSLPPWGASGRMLRLIRDTLETAADAAARSGFNAGKLIATQDAVNVVQRQFIPHLMACLGEGNLILNNREGATSIDDAFDNFVDNAITPHLLNTATMSAAILPGGANAAAVAGNIGAIAGAGGERVADTLVASLGTTADRVQSRLTGRLGTAAQFRAAYGAAGAAAVPPVLPAGAGIAINAGAAGDNTVAFDPVQQAGQPAVLSTWANLKATLPPFARAAVNAATAPAELRIADGVDALGAATEQRIFRLTHASIVGGAVGAAYTAAVRFLLNYGSTASTAVELAAAAPARAAVLNLLAAVRTDVEADIATNVGRAVALIESVAGAAPNAATAAVNLDRNALKAAVDAFFATAANAGTFGSYVVAQGGVPQAHNADSIKAGIDRAFTTAQQLVANLPPRAGAGAPIDARAYTRSRLFRFNQSVLPRVGFNQAVIVIRPSDDALLATSVDLDALKAVFTARGALDGSARDAASSSVLDILAIRDRRNALDTSKPVALIGAPGGLPSLEQQVRQSENFGTGVTIDYGTAGAIGDLPRGAIQSRYSVRTAPAAPVAFSSVVPIPGAAEPGVPIELATPSMRENWQAIGTDIRNPVTAAIARVFLGTPTNWRNVRAMLHSHVLMPFTVVLTRPFIVLETLSMYFLKAGTETMRTIFGQPNTTVRYTFTFHNTNIQQWGNDPGHQAYEVTIAFKSRTIVTKPENIFPVHNAFLSNYDGGMGVEFFTPTSLKEYLDRGDITADHPSIIAIAEPYEPYLRRTPPVYFSLTGSFREVNVLNQFRDDPRLNETKHYYNASYARSMWGFPHHAAGAFYRDEGNLKLQNFVHGLNEADVFFSHMDFVVWAGQTIHVDPRSGLFALKRKSNGLIPDDRYGPGLLEGLRKYTKEMKKQDFSAFTDI